jgi:long-chain acyl-CoA synthetase
MRLTQALQQAAIHLPNRIATVCGDRQRTYSEVVNRVAKLAAGFNAMGASRGDRVAILALNSDDYYEALYAILWAGCLAVPLNTRLSMAEHIAVFEDCEPRLILIDRQFSPVIAELLPRMRERIVLIGDAEGSVHAEALLHESPPILDQGGADAMAAAIFYTGGTTGRSKGVLLSHDNLIINFLAATAAEPYPQHSIYLHAPPMFHLADATMVLGLTMLGGTHVILPRFDPAAVVQAIERHSVNTLVLVPTMIGMLDQYLLDHPHDLASVRRLTYGASPISETLMKRALAIFPSARINQAYGQTELSPVATLLTHEYHVELGSSTNKLRSAGIAIPGVEIRIVDAVLHDLPLGEIGEIVVRGPNVMLGYWNNPALTAETIIDGWLRTGDAGYLDAEGFLFIVDRVKDMIISGGENVYCAEVENALAQHPSVLECAVIGIPDSRWGERVHAVVRLREGCCVTEKELITHCGKLIANYKRPKSFAFTTDPLPLSGTGKVLKSALREALGPHVAYRD